MQFPDATKQGSGGVDIQLEVEQIFHCGFDLHGVELSQTSLPSEQRQHLHPEDVGRGQLLAAESLPVSPAVLAAPIWTAFAYSQRGS